MDADPARCRQWADPGLAQLRRRGVDVQLDHLVLGRAVALVRTVAERGRPGAGKILDLAHRGDERPSVEIGSGRPGRRGEQVDGLAPADDGSLLLEEVVQVPRGDLGIRLVPDGPAPSDRGVVATPAPGAG